jgi:uncharacterized cofD-like protein
VFLQPANAQANPEAIRAILEADIVVVGPGSLLTSVLPNLLVDGIRQALAISQAMKIYVSNVATQHGETDGFSAVDHFETLSRHVGRGLFDYVLANDNIRGPLPQAWQSAPVVANPDHVEGVRLVTADVVSERNRYYHEPEKLASAIMRLYLNRPQQEPAAEAVAVASATR